MTDPEIYFVGQVAELARSLGAFSAVEIRDEEMALDLTRDVEDATPVIAYLRNIFSETRDLTPQDRVARIRYFLEGIADPPDVEVAWEDAQQRVFSVIRSPAMFAATPEARPVKTTRTLPCLVECVALDLGRTLTYVSDDQAKRWGVDAEALFAAARLNVESVLEHSIEPWDVNAPYPMWHVAADDAYESSRLLAPAFLKAMTQHVTGRLVCAIPERSTMLLTGDASNDAVARLADTAEREYVASTRGISPALYSIDDDGRAVPLQVSDDHPLSRVVRCGHVLLANSEYAEQKRALDAEHEEKDIDLFVATFMATQRDDEIRTIATWSRDVETLLPATDFVAFVSLGEDDEPSDSMLVKWSDVERLVASCYEDCHDLWPLRRRTLRFPNPEELALLRECAID